MGAKVARAVSSILYVEIGFVYALFVFSVFDGNMARAQTLVDTSGLFASTVYIVADAQLVGSTQRRQFFGSGVIVTPEGHVLTAAHVLPDIVDPQTYTDVHVTGVIGNKFGFPIELQRTGLQNVGADLIVLKFPAGVNANLKPAQVPSKVDVAVDSSVIIAGFPLSLDTTVVRGRIATLNGPGETWITDAKIQEGSSGSPVFDLFGQLIGIASGGFQTPGNPNPLGLNLIIPISKARSLWGLAWQISSSGSRAECKGTPIQLSGSDASFPASASVPISRSSNASELPGILATSYPSVILDDATIRLADAKSTAYRFCRLELRGNSRLIVGEKQILILSNYFSVSSGQFVGSQPDGRTDRVPDTVTNTGQTGQAGIAGRSSGSVLLGIVLRFDGSLRVELDGEHGGPGGAGGPGAAGAEGAAGSGGSDSLFDCRRGPGDGQRGAPGGQGAPGGAGGNGGDGGNLQIYRLSTTIFPVGSISFTGRGGRGGAGGLGGQGGPGGAGGLRGSQTTFCHGGSNGPNGPAGPNGRSGAPGEMGIDGAKQDSVVVEQDLINIF